MRRHRIEDFDDCAAMWSDPVVTRYIGGRPFSEEESWARLLRYIGHWAALGFGYWVIEEKATGNFIGEVGFAGYKRDIQPSIQEMPELGWVFVTRIHGKGYATETVRAAAAWGDAHFGSIRTVCLIHPENLTSIRVAEKCGYREYQRSIYKGHPTILFARDSREKPLITPG
jgi:RimJ/RimL family protein N-acetyltransferase